MTFSTLQDIFCLMFGTGSQSQLVQFVSGLVVSGYFVLLALNENGANVSAGIKIFVLIMALTSVTGIVNELFGISITC